MVVKTLQSSHEQQLPWVETPLRESYALSQAAGCRIFLKMETLQPSGSFKSRGIGNYILRRLEDLPANTATIPHIFCSSGGNAGLAAVHASRTLGLPCTVVVPTSTKPLMVAKIKAAGAYEIVQHGATWADADKYMRENLMPIAGPSAIYTPPFDHPDIWCGNATVMHEIASQIPSSPADIIICSVGGGGLLNGVAQGLDQLSLTDRTTVIGVETAGAESMHAALQAGQLVTLPSITSQATSLGCTTVTQRTLDYAQRLNVRSVVLPDAEAAMGCWRLADDERVMVELACGVNVALCYDGRLERALGRKVQPHEKVVIVLCGGCNVTVDMLAEWRSEYAYLEDVSGAKDEDIPSVPSEVTAGEAAPQQQQQWKDVFAYGAEAKL